MKKIFSTKKRIVCFCLVFIMMFSGLTICLATMASAADVKKYSYTGDQPFFNYYLDNCYEYDTEGAPNKWFASVLPPTTNTSNFCSLGTTEFANINGKTVTVDSLYRVQGESLNDPNYAMGILIYQCIEYKVAHPTEPVEIYFSTYRLSSTAAVCIDRNSAWFGYMRSLFDCEYDDYGFVRISFMLVEAARMGIQVNIIPHLNSYAVLQDADNESGYEKKEAHGYATYFNSALSKPCYEEYEKSKKVSDFLTLTQIKWDVDARGGDMHHIKTCLVSNYIDKDGTEHGKSIFLTSANLDDNNYRGCNGNGGSQSGVIISDHDEIYDVVYNYLEVIRKNPGKEDVAKFRDYVASKQTEQIDLIRASKGATIPDNEKLVYLGSDTDDVFEMYFTPLPGAEGVWDKEYNPYCKYLSEMLKSEDYIVFTWNMPYNQCTNYFEYTFEDIICEAFHKNRSVNNRLYLQFESFDKNKYNDLAVGQDIGFKKVNANTKKIHSKDILMSYQKDGERKYVSLITSCNFGNSAFWYRSNSLLVIKETEASHSVYTNLGAASTCGAIEKEGLTFRDDKKEPRYSLTNTFSKMPMTFEAQFDCNADVSNQKGCTIIGNYFDTYLPGISFRVYLNGCPSLCLRYDRDHQDQFTMGTSILGKGKVSVAFTIDDTNVYGYLDGKLVLTKAHCGYMPELTPYPFSVGGDNREDNSWNFRNGSIYSINLFSEYRTATQIKNDIASVDLKDDSLMLSYDFTQSMHDRSKNSNDIYKYYYDGDFVSPDTYDYTMVAVGDTQAIAKYYPEYLDGMYQFIVDNKDTMKIERVIGLGDITNDCTDDQWIPAADAISKLNGVIPYSLIRGNHDAFTREEDKKVHNGEAGVQSDKFYQYFGNDVYAAQYDGAYNDDPTNTYSLQTIGGIKYLFVNLDFGPSDAVLEWAGDLCEQYSDYNVIISTHCFLFRDNTTLDANDLYPATGYMLENDGDGIWEKLGSKYANISMIICGHDPINNIVTSRFEGDNGNAVTCLLIDQQYIDSQISPSGMLTFLHFSNSGKTVTVETYSIVKNQFYKLNNQFTIPDINVVN